MMIAGHTEETIKEALDKANMQYNGNLTLKQLERHGTTGRSKYLDVRITVKTSRIGGEIAPGVSVGRAYYAGAKERALGSASWDAHGVFMRWLYRINPQTVIRCGSISTGSYVLRSRDDLRKHWG